MAELDASGCPAGPPPSKSQIRRWRRYLAEERQEAATYAYLARSRAGEEREILEGLARAESRHEEYWLKLLGLHAYPPPRAPLRSWVMARFARFFGSIFALALAQRAETRTAYEAEPDAPAHMAADEQIHSEVVRALAAKGRRRMSGSFRAAVFGANDGLVSNLSLVLGVAAAGVSAQLVLLSGLAGLLAGALSMAAGEYISVRSQRELLEASLPEAAPAALVRRLDVESNELALIYRARGDDPATAEYKAEALFAKLSTAADKSAPLPQSNTYQEVGTALAAAFSSFAFFAGGAVIPLLPFIFGASAIPAMVIAVGLVSVALLITGSLVGILSGQAPLPRALRQLAIGLVAAGITYLLGWGFGVSVS